MSFPDTLRPLIQRQRSHLSSTPIQVNGPKRSTINA